MNCLAHWGLRTNPLAPERLVAGAPVQFRFGSMRLEPLRTPSHLEFYFNLYDWKDPDRLEGIGPAGVRTVPVPSNEMLTFVLSGARGCGRFSLQNLLLYEIRERTPGRPTLVVASAPVIVGADRMQTAQDFTTALYDAFTGAGGDRAELRTVVRELREDYGDTPVTPQIQFGKLRARIQALLPGVPIVFCLDARDANVTRDMAKGACDMLKPLADYAILSMTDSKAAGHVRGYFSMNRAPSAWVDAPQVDKALLERFLVARLQAERTGSVATPPLHPFTQGALDELFAPSSGASAEAVRFSMRRILQEVHDLVEQKCAAWPVGPPPTTFEITAQDVRELRARR